MKTERIFYVETPLGKLKVWAKHERDEISDYPGVYIDFIPHGEPDDCSDYYMTAVVEYDNVKNCIQTCVYQPWSDAPIEIIERDHIEEE